MSRPTLLKARRQRFARRFSSTADAEASSPIPPALDVVVWNGNVTSYLALDALFASKCEGISDGVDPLDDLALLAVFGRSGIRPEHFTASTLPASSLLPSYPDAATGNLPAPGTMESGTSVRDLMDQAKAIGADLMVIPMDDSTDAAYQKAVVSGLRKLEEETGKKVGRLVLSDCRDDLQDLMEWRAALFEGAGYSPEFPLWGRPYSEILQFVASLRAPASPEAESGGPLVRPKRIVISAVADSPSLSATIKGSELDEEMWRLLGEVGVDEVGELGELQTRLVF